METGYDISDPKHPDFHSIHADLWDNREKDGQRNPLIHWEVTVLEGVAERFATNSLPLAVRILERMGESGSDLDDFVLIVQRDPGALAAEPHLRRCLRGSSMTTSVRVVDPDVTGSGDLYPLRTSAPQGEVERSGDGQRGKAVRSFTPSRRAPVRASKLSEPLPPDERSERSRYHIYRLRAGELVSLATTGTPAGIGVTLVTLHKDGEFDRPDDCVGVLDCGARGYDKPGVWIVHPFALGRKR